MDPVHDNDPDPSCMIRIVTLLVALAALAERAAARPLAIRLLVHWLLSNAERAALTLLIDPAEIEAQARSDDSFGIDRCDLLRLAARLQAIAMLLAPLVPADAGEPTIRPLAQSAPRFAPHLVIALPIEDTS